MSKNKINYAGQLLRNLLKNVKRKVEIDKMLAVCAYYLNKKGFSFRKIKVNDRSVSSFIYIDSRDKIVLKIPFLLLGADKSLFHKFDDFAYSDFVEFQPVQKDWDDCQRKFIFVQELGMPVEDISDKKLHKSFLDLEDRAEDYGLGDYCTRNVALFGEKLKIIDI